jgi:hypothetical protein
MYGFNSEETLFIHDYGLEYVFDASYDEDDIFGNDDFDDDDFEEDEEDFDDQEDDDFDVGDFDDTFGDDFLDG